MDTFVREWTFWLAILGLYGVKGAGSSLGLTLLRRRTSKDIYVKMTANVPFKELNASHLKPALSQLQRCRDVPLPESW